MRRSSIVRTAAECRTSEERSEAGDRTREDRRRPAASRAARLHRRHDRRARSDVGATTSCRHARPPCWTLAHREARACRRQSGAAGCRARQVSLGPTPARPAGGRAARCGRRGPAPSGRSARRGSAGPVARASSSMSTGAGPSAASTSPRLVRRLAAIARWRLRRAARAPRQPPARDSGCRSIGARARQDVLGLGDQGRARLQQLVGALRARVERMARHGEHLAALLGGHARGDQRARAARRLDDHHAERDAGDDAVAAREVLGARLEARRHLADEAAALGDLRAAARACSGG